MLPTHSGIAIYFKTQTLACRTRCNFARGLSGMIGKNRAMVFGKAYVESTSYCNDHRPNNKGFNLLRLQSQNPSRPFSQPPPNEKQPKQINRTNTLTPSQTPPHQQRQTKTLHRSPPCQRIPQTQPEEASSHSHQHRHFHRL